MEMRNPARAEMLANFTPMLCFNALFDKSDAFHSTEDAEHPAPQRGAGDRDGSLNSLCSLVERMWLHPAEADMHRPTYEEMMSRALTRCAPGSARDGLVETLRCVSSRNYVRALAALRAVAA